MEGTIDMTSNAASNITAAAPAPHNHQQQEAVVVSSPPTKKEQARNTKKPRAAQQAGGSGGQAKPRPLQDAALCCPRCCSTNTKFCYYNNYNLTQPRYICKTCRRYWTQGGSLRHVPVGGGCRRNNKRASAGSVSSSSAASSTAASSAEVTARLTILMPNSPTSTRLMPSPTTGLLPNGMPPAVTPTGGSGGLDLAMVDDQQCFLPFPPLPLSDDQAPPELAPGGSDDTAPTLLDTLTLKGGYPDGGGSSSGYGGAGGLAMSGGSNGMDMSFLLPGMGASATDDPMQTQLVEGMMMNDVAGELQWASSELDNYIIDDGGYAYAARPAAGVEQQQQVVGGQRLQEEDNNTATESSKNNNDDGGSPMYNSYWFNTNSSDGAEG